MALDPPRSFARFREVTFVGEGGMGRVYRAVDAATGKLVALKFAIVDPQHLDREFEISRRVASSGISGAIDRGVYDSYAYLVFPWVAGETLFALAHVWESSRTPVAPCVVEYVAQAMLSTLVKLHRERIVHRDISPENIVVSPDGNLCLIDFGTASQFGGVPLKTRIGKPGFAPPEQEEGQTVPSSDVFALGVTLCRLAGAQGSEPPAHLPQALQAFLTALTATAAETRPDAAKALGMLGALTTDADLTRGSQLLANLVRSRMPVSAAGLVERVAAMQRRAGTMLLATAALWLSLLIAALVPSVARGGGGSGPGRPPPPDARIVQQPVDAPAPPKTCQDVASCERECATSQRACERAFALGRAQLSYTGAITEYSRRCRAGSVVHCARAAMLAKLLDEPALRPLWLDRSREDILMRSCREGNDAGCAAVVLLGEPQPAKKAKALEHAQRACRGEDVLDAQRDPEACYLAAREGDLPSRDRLRRFCDALPSDAASCYYLGHLANSAPDLAKACTYKVSRACLELADRSEDDAAAKRSYNGQACAAGLCARGSVEDLTAACAARSPNGCAYKLWWQVTTGGALDEDQFASAIGSAPEAASFHNRTVATEPNYKVFPYRELLGACVLGADEACRCLLSEDQWCLPSSDVIGVPEGLAAYSKILKEEVR